jgi:hypothetical protein
MFSGLYPDKDDQLEDKEPMDDIADYEEDDITDDEDVDEDVTTDAVRLSGLQRRTTNMQRIDNSRSVVYQKSENSS